MTEFANVYATLYDKFHLNKDYDLESQEVLNLIRNEEPDFSFETLLDMGCGTGMHLAALSKRGIRCFGYDSSEEMIKIARNRCPDAIFFTQIDDLSLNVDCALAMFDVISYITSEEQLEVFFNMAFQQLRVGGYFYADSWNFEGVLSDPPRKVSRTVDFNGQKIERLVHPVLENNSLSEFNGGGISILDIRVKNLNENTELTQEFHQIKAWNPQVVCDLLSKVGFQVIRVFSLNSRDREPNETDFRFGFIARKRGAID
jgi:SAM-dependent methyltransferase